MGGLDGSDTRAGTVSKKELGIEFFPFDDFEASLPTSDPCLLTLRRPRALQAFVGGHPTTKSVDFTITSSEHYTDYFITTGAASKTATLPDPATISGPITFWKYDSGAGEVVLSAGAAYIMYPGGTAHTMYVGRQGQHVTLVPMSSYYMLLSGTIQPVALEPDVGGGWHTLSTTPSAGNILSLTAASSPAWSTCIAARTLVPAGCRLIKVGAIISHTSNSTTGSNTVFSARPVGSSWGTDVHRIANLRVNPSINGTQYQTASEGEIELDTSGDFEYTFAVTNFSAALCQVTAFAYKI
jgi:hypothetical protein